MLQIGDRERRDSVHMLTTQVQGDAAGDQHAQLATGVQQRCDVVAGAEEVLKVIQH